MVGRFSIVLLLLLSLAVVFPATAQDLDNPDVRLRSVQADFVQEKEMAILARPLISTGTFLFQAPGSLRWEYLTPIHTVLLLHDGKIRKFIKREGRFVEEPSMGLDAMQVVLQEISGWLDGEISDTPTFLAEKQGGGRIVLTPRKPMLAKIISSIQLQLLGNSGLMKSVTIHEGQGSFTRMVFSNGRLNLAVAADRFSTP